MSTTPNPIRAALERLVELDEGCTADHWHAAIAAARAALEAAPALPEGYIDPEHQGADRAMLEAYYVTCQAEGGTADEITLRGLRAVLARWGRPTTLPTPAAGEVVEALAARPLLEQVAAIGGCISEQTVGRVRVLADRASAWLAENPPGRPVAIEPRGCPMPGACSCVEPPTPQPVAVSDALIKAECALADIAEGEPMTDEDDPLQWAERRCADTLAIIRPTMRQHNIRTSEWPPIPAHALPLPTTTPAGQEGK